MALKENGSLLTIQRFNLNNIQIQNNFKGGYYSQEFDGYKELYNYFGEHEELSKKCSTVKKRQYNEMTKENLREEKQLLCALRKLVDLLCEGADGHILQIQRLNGQLCLFFNNTKNLNSFIDRELVCPLDEDNILIVGDNCLDILLDMIEKSIFSNEYQSIKENG